MGHPTIRTIVGAPGTTRLDPQTTAFILIDIQNEYYTGKLYVPDGDAVLGNANRLITLADKRAMPVFHIQQWNPVTRPLFTQDSVMAEIHAGLLQAPHHSVIRKRFPSAFASTDLQAQLQARGIKTIILGGILTNNCVAATAYDGVAHGYQMIIASDAVAARGLDVGDGTTISHKDLHKAFLLGLSDAAAEVQATDAILAFSYDA